MFQEVVPAARSAVESLQYSHAHIPIPTNFSGIKGLHARVNSQLVAPIGNAKKGDIFLFLSPPRILTRCLIYLALKSAAKLRPLKGKKTTANDGTPSSVSLGLVYSLQKLIYIFQGKRPRLEQDDEDSEDIEAILDESATPFKMGVPLKDLKGGEARKVC